MTDIVREWSCQDCRWCYYNCKDHSIACEQEDGICDDFEIKDSAGDYIVTLKEEGNK